MSETPGLSSTILAPTLVGVWIHSIDNPNDTEVNYRYQTGARAEKLTVEAASLQFLGRTYPVAEFGDGETGTMTLGVKIPWGEDVAGGMEALRELARRRQTLCYRDSRSRLWYGAIVGDLAITDDVDGSSASFPFLRVDRAAA